MAQDLVILAGTDTLGDSRGYLNDSNEALQTCFSGASEPAAPIRRPYMWWADTTNGILFQRNGANDGWIAKAVLAVALALMPLQGFAQTLALLVCLPHMAHHAQMTGQTGHSHGDGGDVSHDQHGGAQHDASHDSTGSGTSDHFCCNVVAPALPAVVQPVAVPLFSAPVLSSGVFHYTTFLKLPQRPPLV